MKWIFMTLIILVIIVSLVYVGYRLFQKELSKQSQSNEDKLKQLLGKKDKSSKDYFEIGNIYRHTLYDPIGTADAYVNAVNAQKHDLTSIEVNRMEDFFFNDYVQMSEEGQLNEAIRRSLVDVGITIQPKLHQLKEPTERKPETIQEKFEYLKDNAEVRNDPQSVHDPQANEDIRNILNYVACKNGNSLRMNAIEEIQGVIASHPTVNKNRAMRTLDTVSKGRDISTFNTDEYAILVHVWSRIHSPENNRNRHNMIDAFIAALEASYNDDGTQVCINGTSTNMIQAICDLDADKRIGGVWTESIIKKLVLDKVGAIFKKKLDTADNFSKQSYLAVARTPQQEKRAKEFEDGMKQYIRDRVSREYGPLVKNQERLLEYIEDALYAI